MTRMTVALELAALVAAEYAAPGTLVASALARTSASDYMESEAWVIYLAAVPFGMTIATSITAAVAWYRFRHDRVCSG
jgi:hypothetical protein